MSRTRVLPAADTRGTINYGIKSNIYDRYSDFLERIKNLALGFDHQAGRWGDFDQAFLKSAQFFSPHSAEDHEALLSFFSDYLHSMENIEVLALVGDLSFYMTDIDVLSVLQMRQMKRQPHLVILPYRIIQELMLRDTTFPYVTKLSFLHHHSPLMNERKIDPGYVSEIGNIIKIFPELDHIVLRGCASSFPAPIATKIYSVRPLNNPKATIQQVQGDFVFQQKKLADGGHETWVKYDGKLRSLTNIPWNEDKLGLSEAVQEALYCLIMQGELPLLQLPSVKKIKDDFFKPQNKLGFYQKGQAKKVIPRVRTLQQKNFPPNPDIKGHSSLAERVHAQLLTAGYRGHLKAYTGAYFTTDDRVIPYDKAGSTPIAIRVAGAALRPERRPTLDFFSSTKKAVSSSVSPMDPVAADIRRNLELLELAGATEALLSVLGSQALEMLLIQPSFNLIEPLFFDTTKGGAYGANPSRQPKHNAALRFCFFKLCYCLHPSVRSALFIDPDNLNGFKDLLEMGISFSSIAELAPDRSLIFIQNPSVVKTLLKRTSWEKICSLSLPQLASLSQYSALLERWEGALDEYLSLDSAILEQLHKYHRGAEILFQRATLNQVMQLPNELREAFLNNTSNIETIAGRAETLFHLMERFSGHYISFTRIINEFPIEMLVTYLNPDTAFDRSRSQFADKSKSDRALLRLILSKKQEATSQVGSFFIPRQASGATASSSIVNNPNSAHKQQIPSSLK